MNAIKKKQKAMNVAGVMSGTSADGVDVGIVRISPGDPTPKIRLLGHAGFPYPRAPRAELLRIMEGSPVTAGELSRLNWKLGGIYADCIAKAVEKVGVKIGLVALHGQTIHHEAGVATWQLGEAAVVRERLGVPVVSDFRPADLAAGGQAAPLVPMLDFCQYRSKTRNRVLLNLGGIANLTAIAADAKLDDLLAFDTGPANMVIDAVMQASFRKPFDRAGKVAGRGRILTPVVAETLRLPYFVAAPPKSCGREQFGAVFASEFMDRCIAAGGNEQDAVATATEVTAATILDAYGRSCWPHLGQLAPLAKTEVIAAGGGVHNATLMRRLSEGFAALGVKLSIAPDAKAKEAVAFALLGWLTWHGLPGNVSAATGARGPRILGKISR
jgi:anhydro-N-acetylmuramic acid kinase